MKIRAPAVRQELGFRIKQDKPFCLERCRQKLTFTDTQENGCGESCQIHKNPEILSIPRNQREMVVMGFPGRPRTRAMAALEVESAREHGQGRDYEAAQAGMGWKLEAGTRDPSPLDAFDDDRAAEAAGVGPTTSLAGVFVVASVLALVLAALPPLSTVASLPGGEFRSPLRCTVTCCNATRPIVRTQHVYLETAFCADAARLWLSQNLYATVARAGGMAAFVWRPTRVEHFKRDVEVLKRYREAFGAELLVRRPSPTQTFIVQRLAPMTTGTVTPPKGVKDILLSLFPNFSRSV
jgi:hypothetical protein